MPAKTKALVQTADTLYRAATECHRQHTRHAKLVERGAPDDEQRAALEMAYLMRRFSWRRDHRLREGARGMPPLRRTMSGGTRRTCCGTRARNTFAVTTTVMECRGGWDVSHRNRLAELTMSFEIEASALLALRMAADSYRKARPEAE